ncbi:MAG: AAA family ATPase [Muribaculaceae bacterium]|nr:AAA family ATPase [Muribaculaceae bacterium]
MKRELSGGCGIAILGIALLLIIVGIAAMFDMRSDGDGADGALGFMIFVVLLLPLIYWGYVMLHKFLYPDEPVRLTKKVINYCGGALLVLSAIALWAALTSKPAEVTPKAINEIAQEPKEPKDTVIITQVMEGDPYQELDELIGLESVKEEVHTIANFAKIQQQRKAQGLKVPKMSFHLVFTGSPGTGKTTVARIVARIYKDLGILKSGHTVETDRSGLVAEYVGQTAMKTNAVIDSALNGVLFIDEAYALVPENAGSDYGQEAISTLLKRMEDDRDKLVVIIAGYPDEMKRFIDSNPGLQSRFTRYINFPDYTDQELFEIFQLYLNKNQYTITDDAAELLKNNLNYAVAHKTKNFGNARYVRNIFERAVEQQANRLSAKRKISDEELSLLTKEDIENAFKARK